MTLEATLTLDDRVWRYQYLNGYDEPESQSSIVRHILDAACYARMAAAITKTEQPRMDDDRWKDCMGRVDDKDRLEKTSSHRETCR